MAAAKETPRPLCLCGQGVQKRYDTSPGLRRFAESVDEPVPCAVALYVNFDEGVTEEDREHGRRVAQRLGL